MLPLLRCRSALLRVAIKNVWMACVLTFVALVPGSFSSGAGGSVSAPATLSSAASALSPTYGFLLYVRGQSRPLCGHPPTWVCDSERVSQRGTAANSAEWTYASDGFSGRKRFFAAALTREELFHSLLSTFTLRGVAAKTESGAASAINGVRLRAQLTGEQIAGGHAFDEHVLKAGEFPGITTRQQFATRIEEVVTNGESRELLRGRTAYWEGNTVVIRDPSSLDGGTAFVPTGGYNYFLGLK